MAIADVPASNDEEFVPIDKDAMAELSNAAKPDPIWVERIGNLPVGTGFRIRRVPDVESTRQIKKRINLASKVTHRILEWFPDQTGVKSEDVTSWVIKVRSIDTKAVAEEKAKLAATQNGTVAPNPPQETPQTPTPPVQEQVVSSEENPSGGPRNRR